MHTCMSMSAKDLYRLNVSPEVQTHTPPCLPYISLGYPAHTLNLAKPEINIYHQISITFIAHTPLHKPAALPVLTISVNDITIQPATQARNYKVGFDSTFSIPFLTNYSSNQSKHFSSYTQERSVSLSTDILSTLNKRKQFPKITTLWLHCITTQKGSTFLNYKYSVFRILWWFLLIFKKKSKV